jgi:hypothetical protein
MKYFALAAACAVAAWMLRYDITPTRDPDIAAAYMLDRWTGKVYSLTSGSRALVKDVVLRGPASGRPMTAEEFLDQPAPTK